MESAVLPALAKLVELTRESAAFHVVQNGRRICLFRVESPQLVREHIQVGDILLIDRGAGARVLMAFNGAEVKLYDQIRRQGVIDRKGPFVRDLWDLGVRVHSRRHTGRCGDIDYACPSS